MSQELWLLLPYFNSKYLKILEEELSNTLTLFSLALIRDRLCLGISVRIFRFGMECGRWGPLGSPCSVCIRYTTYNTSMSVAIYRGDELSSSFLTLSGSDTREC